MFFPTPQAAGGRKPGLLQSRRRSEALQQATGSSLRFLSTNRDLPRQSPAGNTLPPPELPGALLADDLDPLPLDHVTDAPQRLASIATENLQAIGLRLRQGDQQATAGLGRPKEHL
jgi:hypothetical protein